MRLALSTLIVSLLFVLPSERISSMDLKDVTSFPVETMPVILKSTKAFGDIVAFEMTAGGTVTVPDKPGLLDLLVHTLNGGTKSYSKETIDRIFIERGAAFSIETRPDGTEISLKCLKKFLPELLPVLGEMLTAPLLEEKEIEITRSQMFANLKGEQDHPDGVLQLTLSRAFFQGHPYSNRASGYLESLPLLTREDLVDLLPKIFNKSNMFVTIIGDISREEATDLIRNNFSRLALGQKAAPVMVVPQNPVGEIVFKKMESPTSYFLAKFKAPSLMNPDYPALVLINQILDHRLFEEVRTKRALTYAVSSGLGNSGVNTGYLYVTSTQLTEATRVIFNEVKKIQTELIDKVSLELQIRKFTSTWYLGREQASSQATILALYEMIGNGWQNSDGFIKRLEAVTPEQMREVALKYFKDMTYGVVGPELPDLSFLPAAKMPANVKTSSKPAAKTTSPSKKSATPSKGSK